MLAGKTLICDGYSDIFSFFLPPHKMQASYVAIRIFVFWKDANETLQNILQNKWSSLAISLKGWAAGGIQAENLRKSVTLSSVFEIWGKGSQRKLDIHFVGALSSTLTFSA